jgi:ABC-2 type transport system permease protein
MAEYLKCGLKMLTRDKMSIFFGLIFPITMTFFLGNLLASYDNPDSRIETINISYVAEADASGAGGTGEQGISEGVNAFASALSGNENIKIEKAENTEAAQKAVDDEKSDAAMIFGSPLKITVYEGKDSIKNRAVTLMAQSFSREYAAIGTAAAQNPQFLERLISGNSISEAGEANAQGGSESPDTYGVPDASKLTKNRDLGINRTMMDFYAVAMLVMIAFMGSGIGGASEMYSLRKRGVIRRLTLSPRNRSRIFFDSMISSLPLNIMQAAVMMILSVLLFGAHYAKTPQDNLLLFAYFCLLSIAVSAFFMLIGIFMKVNPMMPIMSIMLAMLFMSGTFNKDIYIPNVTEYMPMNIAQQAAFDLTMFGRPERVLTVMAACAAILIGSCAAGSLMLKRKETVI